RISTALTARSITVLTCCNTHNRHTTTQCHVTITVIIHNLLAGPHTPETRATYTHTHRVFPQRSLRGA
ncbi:MAG: hypothetical protein ACK56F_26905, partial [bacterium]